VQLILDIFAIPRLLLRARARSIEKKRKNVGQVKRGCALGTEG
jgi:hypothetical protein